MERLRSRTTGVVVNVRDGSRLGSEWGPADQPAGPPPQGDGPPPKAGPGSSRQAWADYATASGVPVDDEATRDDIIAAVEGD